METYRVDNGNLGDCFSVACPHAAVCGARDIGRGLQPSKALRVLDRDGIAASLTSLHRLV